MSQEHRVDVSHHLISEHLMVWHPDGAPQISANLRHSNQSSHTSPSYCDVGYCVHDRYLPLSHLRNEGARCEYS